MLGLDAIAKRSPVPEINVGLVVTQGKKSAGFTVAGSGSGTAIQRGITDCKGILEAPFDAVLQIVGMSVSLQDAIEAKRASVTGSIALVRSFPFCSTLQNGGGQRPLQTEGATGGLDEITAVALR